MDRSKLARRAAGRAELLGGVLLLLVPRGPVAAPPDPGGLAQVALWFALALTLQQAADLDATVTKASVLVNAGVSLESVVGALGAIRLLGERPGPPVLVGAAVLLTAITWAGGPRPRRVTTRPAKRQRIAGPGRGRRPPTSVQPRSCDAAHAAGDRRRPDRRDQ
jgi:hypothetical protein